ncbi:MAG: hypothetical protein EBR82_33220 [Caulobacteraceae bacterium]|nr:hypothetical protein [Caulobacteraceae bacterium]
MDREAIEEAIEVLEDASAEMLTETGNENYYGEAIAVLRQALETEQEPVAFINVEKQKLEWAKLTSWHTPTIVNLPKIPLYTAPPKREWVGLTDEEVSYCRYAATFCDELDTAYMAELIEKDLKEKNHG